MERKYSQLEAKNLIKDYHTMEERWDNFGIRCSGIASMMMLVRRGRSKSNYHVPVNNDLEMESAMINEDGDISVSFSYYWCNEKDWAQEVIPVEWLGKPNCEIKDIYLAQLESAAAERSKKLKADKITAAKNKKIKDAKDKKEALAERKAMYLELNKEFGNG